MTSRKWLASIIGCGLLVACSAQPDVMGTYISSDNDGGAMMVQINTLQDGQISGIMSLVAANEEGMNVAGTRSFSGIIEGKALNLSIENGTGVALATGKLDGNALRLTLFGNGESSQFTLTKASAEEFDELANASRIHAAEKKQEIASAAAFKGQIQQRSKTQSSVDQYANTVIAKAGEVLEKTRKIDVVISGYRAARDRAAKMQSAKRSLDPNSNEDIYRMSKIEFEMDGIANDIESTHFQVQSYKQGLTEFMDEATVKASQFEAECRADKLLNCARLVEGMHSLQTRYQQFESYSLRENVAFNETNGGNS